MAKPTLYLLMGYPGAGKTTVSMLIENACNGVHLWADHERHAMFSDPNHSLSESTQLYEALNDSTAELLNTNRDVIFDTSFNRRSDRDKLRQIAERAGARVVLIWLTTPKKLAKARATHHAQRDRNGYQSTMTEADFERLTAGLETPTPDEQAIEIDGTNIDVNVVLKQLGMQA